MNTGLIATTTDENNQVTTNYYNTDSLRLNYVAYPNGGEAHSYYGDGLMADAAGRYHFYAMVSTKLDSSHWTDVYRFLDGHGALAQIFYQGTAEGPWSSYVTQYDAMGRTVLVTNPFVTGGYGGGLHVGSSDPVSSPSYDHLGRVIGVTTPSGDDANPTTAQTSITYDISDSNHDGILAIATDQDSKERRQKFDALGRLIRLDEPTSSGLGTASSPNQSTTYEYDTLDNLIHITQPGPGSVTQNRYFKYDSLSRTTYEKQVEQSALWTTSDYVAGNNTWSRKTIYNSSGMVTDGYDARQVHTAFGYDDLNRITQISFSDSTPTAYYYYDSQSLPSGAPSYNHGYTTGRLLAMTYGASGSATGNYFGYDNVGNVVAQRQVTGSTTYALSYTYNLAGMLLTETYPSNRMLTYAYDAGARLSSLSDGTNTFASSVSFAANGGMTSETLGNTAVHTMNYNRGLQVSQIKLTLGSVLQQYDYKYGRFDTSTGAVDTTKNNGQVGNVTSTIGSTTQWLQGFTYDEVGRLSNVAEYQGGNMNSQTYSQGYTYDRYGNRFQSANTTLGLAAVSSSEIDSATNRFVSSVATYDNGQAGAGNITSDAKFRGLSYGYDANGRQTSASDGNWTETQTYDCAGQRVRTTVSGATRTTVYDVFGQQVADYTGSTGGTLERENIYREAQLLVTYEAGSSSYKYLLQDTQGATRALMNNSGTIISCHDYLPFGEDIWSGIGSRTTGQGFATSPWANDTLRQRYALTERDDTTGLDHTWWRKYESRSGRWTTPDPYGGSASVTNPQSFNRYSYTHNDPENLVDPSGLLDSWNCFVDGMPVNCGMAFALVNMGAGRVLGGPGFYLDGSVLVVNQYSPNKGNDGWRLTGQYAYFNPDSFTQAVDKAFDRAKKILQGTSPCAQFFGPNALAALEAMRKTFKVVPSGDNGATRTGIAQSYPGGVNAIPSGPYRTPGTFTFYQNGPFFAGGTGSIAGYRAGSPMAQNAAILHELAHNIKNAAGNGFLIPNDGPGTKEGLSQDNTALINKKCEKEIFDGK